MKKNDNKTPRRAFVHSGSRRFRDIPKGFRQWYGNFCRHVGNRKFRISHPERVTVVKEV